MHHEEPDRPEFILHLSCKVAGVHEYRRLANVMLLLVYRGEYSTGAPVLLCSSAVLEKEGIS